MIQLSANLALINIQTTLINVRQGMQTDRWAGRLYPVKQWAFIELACSSGVFQNKFRIDMQLRMNSLEKFDPRLLFAIHN